MIKRADMLHIYIYIYGTVNFFQIGELKKGLNPPSFGDLVFVSPYLTVAIKTGIITGVIALAVRSLLIPSLLYAYMHTTLALFPH